MGLAPALVAGTLGADVDMMREGEAPPPGSGLIAPRRLMNPCLDSPQRMDLHRELLFNQKMYVDSEILVSIYSLYCIAQIIHFTMNGGEYMTKVNLTISRDFFQRTWDGQEIIRYLKVNS